MIKKDLALDQGKTFKQVIRWESAPIIYKAITAITQAAPTVVSSTGHGIPDGWRVAIVSAKGMTAINATNSPLKDSDYTQATLIDANSISLNAVNSSLFSAYTSGGYIQYNTPVDLTGYTARMTIKTKVGGVILDTLTNVNGKIVLDITKHTITLLLDAVTTAAYTWARGVYDLELVSASGAVTGLLYGAISVSKEVTT
jgi:hypothetical protein